MHNPGLMNIPPTSRTVSLPPHLPRAHPPSDYIPINPQLHNSLLPQRQPNRNRHNPQFIGNQFYNRTKRKRDSSSGNRNPPFENNPQMNGRLEEPERIPNPTPWNPTSSRYSDGIIGLHEEIEDFVQWMVPTSKEHNLRLTAVKRLRLAMKDIYPSAVVKIFGSFRTGLYLPTSDIDLVIFGHWEPDQIPFETVRNGIAEKKLAKPGSLQLLEHATVPIIKMTDCLTEIKMDISFNMTSGLRSAELIKYFKKKYPAVTKLIFVLKQFLLQRDLNEVYTGGLSSYALLLMVVSFLQLHPRGESAGSHRANLGVLLIEFFELYGRHFNYATTAIRVSDGGSYEKKDELRATLTNMGAGIGALCIEDPYLPSNDVGRSSYGMPVVKQVFEHAYLTLTQILTQRNGKTPDGDSLLSQIFRVSNDVISFRKWVESLTIDLISAEIDSALSTEQQNGAAAIEDSEDPKIPIQVTPTSSKDVEPRELSLNTFERKNDSVFGAKGSPDFGGKSLNKENYIMSGVSSSSSDSATSQTDTDSDVIIVGRSGGASPEGSPTSVMSISPASSEVGILQNGRNSGQSNGRRPPRVDQNNYRENRYVGNSQRGNGRYRTGHGNRNPVDLIKNWRSDGPDKDRDWRKHEEPAVSDRKDSESVSQAKESKKDSEAAEKASDSKRAESGDIEKLKTKPVSSPSAAVRPDILDSGDLSLKNDSKQVGDTSSLSGSSFTSDKNFKGNSWNNKKRRKYKKNKRNESTASLGSSVQSSQSVKNDSEQNSQSRFSPKVGQSKPKR